MYFYINYVQRLCVRLYIFLNVYMKHVTEFACILLYAQKYILRIR